MGSSFVHFDNKNRNNKLPAMGMRWTAFHQDRVEVVILLPWVASKEVTHVPVLVLMHSFDASSLRESAKSTLLVHVLASTCILTEAFGIKGSPPSSLGGLGSVYLFFEVACNYLKMGWVCPYLGDVVSVEGD